MRGRLYMEISGMLQDLLERFPDFATLRSLRSKSFFEATFAILSNHHFVKDI